MLQPEIRTRVLSTKPEDRAGMYRLDSEKLEDVSGVCLIACTFTIISILLLHQCATDQASYQQPTRIKWRDQGKLLQTGRIDP
jgi:hypothetical protein